MISKNQNIEQEIYDTITNLLSEIVSLSSPQCSRAASREEVSITQRELPLARSHFLKGTASLERSNNEVKPTFEIYRAFNHFQESLSEVNVQFMVRTEQPRLPPSYSTAIKGGQPYLDIHRAVEGSDDATRARVPPPAYAEIPGSWSEMTNSSSEQILLGPEPLYIWCNRCSIVVISSIKSQRSKFTHFAAGILCVLGCWPCAMLPYLMNSCKNIYHYCPECNYLFGMYRPW